MEKKQIERMAKLAHKKRTKKEGEEAVRLLMLSQQEEQKLRKSKPKNQKI